MKISELIEHLEKHKLESGDLEVLGTWEGTEHEIDASDLKVEEACYFDEKGVCLFIDVD